MAIINPARLARLQQWPLVKPNWHWLSATVLNVCNYSEEVPIIYQHALKTEPESSHEVITAKFRESLLKSACLIGVPRVINGLTELKNVTPEHLRAKTVLRDTHKDSFGSVGTELFHQVYGKITDRVHGNMYAAYPDLDWFVTNHEYGPLLSYMGVLTPRETCLGVVASLVPQDVNPQLKGHLRGAWNNGASVEEVNSVRDLSFEISKWCGVTWRHEISHLVLKKK